LVFFEVANILLKQFRKPYSDIFSDYLSPMRIASGEEMVELTSDFETYFSQVAEGPVQIGLKTSDMLIFLASYMHDAALISWDKNLLREAKKLCGALTPRDFLQEKC